MLTTGAGANEIDFASDDTRRNERLAPRALLSADLKVVRNTGAPTK